MARIRTIKPEFWTDEKLLHCSLSARLLLIGMLNFADDKGNIEAGPMSIKGRIFPCDNLDVKPLLLELVGVAVLIPYDGEGESYYHIKGFAKHQLINNPSSARCPLYDGSVSPTVALPSGREGKGRERKVKEVNPSCPDSSKPEPRPQKFSEDDLTFAKRMYIEILAIFPNLEKSYEKKVKIEAWADIIRLMRESDKLPMLDIMKVWEWARDDYEFWQGQIRSPNNLRKHFEALRIKMNGTKKPPKKHPSGIQPREGDQLNPRVKDLFQQWQGEGDDMIIKLIREKAKELAEDSCLNKNSRNVLDFILAEPIKTDELIEGTG